MRVLTEIYVLQKSLGEIAVILMTAGKWRHSMCLDCFRKRWPSGKHSAWQVPENYECGKFAAFACRNTKTAFIERKIPEAKN